MNAETKIKEFFNESIKCFGKEIALKSNQEFCINELVNKEKESKGIYSYSIQYGFPQSGCVFIKFEIEGKKGNITDVEVHAKPKGESMVTANYSTQIGIEELGVGIKTGLDIGTKKYSGVEEIDENPNALQMLDIAISDLKQALILGDCHLHVLADSDMIPVCDTTEYPDTLDSSEGLKK